MAIINRPGSPKPAAKPKAETSASSEDEKGAAEPENPPPQPPSPEQTPNAKSVLVGLVVVSLGLMASFGAYKFFVAPSSDESAVATSDTTDEELPDDTHKDDVSDEGASDTEGQTPPASAPQIDRSRLDSLIEIYVRYGRLYRISKEEFEEASVSLVVTKKAGVSEDVIAALEIVLDKKRKLRTDYGDKFADSLFELHKNYQENPKAVGEVLSTLKDESVALGKDVQANLLQFGINTIRDVPANGTVMRFMREAIQDRI